MDRHDVKAMIGDFSEIENEKLLEKIIENYKDDDASYNEAYLISQNDEKNENEYFAVLDHGTYFTVIDEHGNATTYDEDDVSERYAEIDIQSFEDYFEDCEYDDRFYKLFKPLWKDIYYTIIEYMLDEEKFLRYFMKNDGEVDYDVVRHYYNCLKNDSVSDFVKEYKSNL